MAEAAVDAPQERRIDFIALARTVRLTSRRSKRTEKTLQDHVDGCAKTQRRVLYVAGITLAWVIGHSPEVLAGLGGIFRALVP